MAMDRFLIAPFDKNSGLNTSYKPYLIPDEAFSTLDNAYVFRGRVRKRFGSVWLGNTQLESRFRINLGTLGNEATDVNGNWTGFVPRNVLVPIATPAIGQMFSVSTEVFTVNALGLPATLLRTGPNVNVSTFNTTTGAVSIVNAAPFSSVYYYPALPVMGLQTFESTAINNEPIIGFDTRFAYRYSGGWERIEAFTVAGDSSWQGTDSQFFWTTTWHGADAAQKLLFVTNFNENESRSMRYYDNVKWMQFLPKVSSTENMYSARILIPFKNRLLALNTWEGTVSPGTNYQNRVRYSQIGDPLAVTAWQQDVRGKGNAIDAPTSEQIVSAEFVKDRLIVFFESSTWELVYTSNQAYPFVWQQINVELGSESTFSIVPFDKLTIGVGNVGIHACNGANVMRIDDKIPQAVFDIHNVDQGVYRVYGIRDYYVEMLYWTMPDITRTNDRPYPNRVLIYNYQTGTWAFNDDSITCFGYTYIPSTVGITWDSETITWDDDVSWDSGSLSAGFKRVIAGNQEGYTFIIDTDVTTNAPAIQITDIVSTNNYVLVSAVNHNLKALDYVYFQDIVGTGNLSLMNGKIFQVASTTVNTFVFIYFDSSNNVLSGAYKGNGVISRVSNIHINTKEYNFYADKGRNASIQRVDFLVDRTDTGAINVDYYISTSSNSMLTDGNGILLGTGVLETTAYPLMPLEQNAARVWHPLYFQADGECIQLSFKFSDEQMRNPSIREADFQLHSMLFVTQPTSYRLQ